MNQKAIETVMAEEGFRAKPYLCTSGKPTIGYGTTYYTDGRLVTLQDAPITEREAYRLLIEHLQKLWGEMLGVLNVQVTDNQFAALTSFCYNFGVPRFAGSTLLRMLNAGDYEGAAAQFAAWNKETKAGKKVPNAALSARRAREARLFLTPDEVTSGNV